MSPKTTDAPKPQAPRAGKDFWPQERQGYSDIRTVAYASAPPAPAPKRRSGLLIQTEERIATLIATGGLLWTVRAASLNLAGVTRIGVYPPGPLEICAIGILVWLHAKWRRAVNLD